MAETTKGVRALYRVIQLLNDELTTNPFCNSVTMGTLTEIDLAKQTIFPMAHLTLESVTHHKNSLSFQITIFNLDIVEISKDLPEVAPNNSTIYSPNLYGNDNLVYVWTNQLYVINRLVARLKESSIYQPEWQLDGDPSSDFINKEMENMLAGFQTTIVLTVPNDVDKCSEE